MDPRYPDKELPDKTRRLMVDGMGETGLWIFPDGTAWLSEGLELYRHGDAYLITFREDVITEFAAKDVDREALDRLVVNAQ